MSKELEALERIKQYTMYPEDIEGCKIIETALKRLEELEKAFISLSKEDEKTKKLLSKEIEKNRALEIIKNKKVNVWNMLMCNLEVYNTNFVYQEWRKLIQEEYDLLKEVLK